MKTAKIYLSLLILLSGISACNARPKIVFSDLKHDFGIVKPGSEVKHKFTFKNKGSSLLIIERIKST